MTYEQWLNHFEKIAFPVLRGFADKTIMTRCPIIRGPSSKSINTDNCGYIEMLCRTLLGVAPLLKPELPTYYPQYSERYAVLRNLTLAAIKNAFDGYFVWECGDQLLVEAGLLCLAFLRNPVLFTMNDAKTQATILAMLKKAYQYPPHTNNWVLFSAAVAAFLQKHADVVNYLKTLESWYIGDGWYKDGGFHMDYYNSYIIYPFLIDIMKSCGIPLTSVYDRAGRYCEFLERMIGSDGTFPYFGRSAVYRCAVFHTLTHMASLGKLPVTLEYGACRAALTAVLSRFFDTEMNFTDAGFLHLGFQGHQPMIADVYSNTGSTYFALVVFEPLCLPPSHPFWSAPDSAWTQQRLWNGGVVLKDGPKFVLPRL